MPNENFDRFKEKVGSVSSKLKGLFKGKLGGITKNENDDEEFVDEDINVTPDLDADNGYGTVLLYVISTIGGEERRQTIRPSIDSDFKSFKIMIGELMDLKPSDFIISLYGESMEEEKETFADLDVQDEDKLIISAKK